ncbi:hypothetical protein, conserved [Plasmodium vivax]|uniref:VIR protein n=1 Tax=Plasmodium vivax TaxID=5855 RepID=A0A1G4E6B9_PLAVI|nr:hypothetical protein, conserved [Plasmodium vivax]
MAKSIYTYVNEFPKFESEVSAIPDNSISSYQSDCQSFIDDKLSSYSDIKDAFLNRCAKIVKHLEDKKSTPEFKPAFCKYINYWLYDTLKDKNPFSSDTLLNAFYDKIKKISDCKTYKKHIDKEVYDELTELYKLHDHLIKYKKESIKGQGYEEHSSNEDKKCSVKMQYLTPFTSFGSWLRPRLPGSKNKTKKLEKRMQELQNTADVRNSRYKLPYHSSYP